MVAREPPKICTLRCPGISPGKRLQSTQTGSRLFTASSAMFMAHQKTVRRSLETVDGSESGAACIRKPIIVHVPPFRRLFLPATVSPAAPTHHAASLSLSSLSALSLGSHFSTCPDSNLYGTYCLFTVLSLVIPAFFVFHRAPAVSAPSPSGSGQCCLSRRQPPSH